MPNFIKSFKKELFTIVNCFVLNFKRNIVETSDGSKTIELIGMNEHYHSVHGAVQESLHVFIQNGLQFQLDRCRDEVRVLEIGFGTGLNFLTTIQFLQGSETKLEYIGVDAFPLPPGILNELSYDNRFAEELISFCKKVLIIPNEFQVSSTHNAQAKQITSTLNKVKLPKAYFDLLYFDAFGPRVQPEMWTTEVFGNMYDSLSVGGCLVTYCAKGEVKRSLKAVGFMVESLPGPPGKREMTRALKL
jgi:tRNA U34 5-methylaminomethyl-2-thiouridine-forming methyltransferase MnmC